MPIFEPPPLETLTPARERWTPLYLEHGRIEVDDASVKWIGADRTILRIPVATVSVLMLGPGTTVTHAAVKACADCNTPICWIGADGMRFYAVGSNPTSGCERARRQAAWHASKSKREEVARRMFRMRFPADEVAANSVANLMGMEGRRVKALYERLGAKYGVTWKGRNYNPNNWECADAINRAVSAANAALYALTTAVVCSLGYLPQLGFIHSAGSIPFVCDIADLYKEETTFEAAFHTVSIKPEAEAAEVITMLKQLIEETKALRRMPVDMEKLFDDGPHRQ
jgi:CRISPR-associated protein Cas1